MGAVLGFALILSYIFLNLDYKKRIVGLVAILILCIFILIVFLNLSLFEKSPIGIALSRLAEFGTYSFNYTIGEQPCFRSSEWLNSTDLLQIFRSLSTRTLQGDIYAILDKPHLEREKFL